MTYKIPNYGGGYQFEDVAWDDLRVPITAIKVGGSFPPTFGAFGPSGNLLTYLFVGTGPQINQIYFVAQIPHTYKEGTDLKPHLHWTPTDAGGGDVEWFLEYVWLDIGDDAGAPTTISATDTASGVAWEHQAVSLPSMTGTGKDVSSQLICRLYRDPTDVDDTYGANAALLEFDFHFEVNSLGSDEEFSKE